MFFPFTIFSIGMIYFIKKGKLKLLKDVPTFAIKIIPFFILYTLVLVILSWVLDIIFIAWEFITMVYFLIIYSVLFSVLKRMVKGRASSKRIP